jgi:hypothetical protein
MASSHNRPWPTVFGKSRRRSPPAALFAVDPHVLVGGLAREAQVPLEPRQTRTVQRREIVAVALRVQVHVQIETESGLDLLAVLGAVLRRHQPGGGTVPGSHLVGGVKVRFGRVHVVSVLAPVHQNHVGRQRVQHAVDKRGQQAISGRNENAVRLHAPSGFEVDAVQPECQQHGVREFAGHGLNELRPAAAG